MNWNGPIKHVYKQNAMQTSQLSTYKTMFKYNYIV